MLFFYSQILKKKKTLTRPPDPPVCLICIFWGISNLVLGPTFLAICSFDFRLEALSRVGCFFSLLCPPHPLRANLIPFGLPPSVGLPPCISFPPLGLASYSKKKTPPGFTAKFFFFFVVETHSRFRRPPPPFFFFCNPPSKKKQNLEILSE